MKLNKQKLIELLLLIPLIAFSVLGGYFLGDSLKECPVNDPDYSILEAFNSFYTILDSVPADLQITIEIYLELLDLSTELEFQTSYQNYTLTLTLVNNTYDYASGVWIYFETESTLMHFHSYGESYYLFSFLTGIIDSCLDYDAILLTNASFEFRVQFLQEIV